MKIATGRVKRSTRPFADRARRRTTADVADLLFILITTAFVAVCVAYVSWCDRIIGPDAWTAEAPTDAPADAEREEVTA